MKEARVVCPKCKGIILMQTESQVIDGAIQEVDCPNCKNHFKIRCRNTPDILDANERANSNPYNNMYGMDSSYLKKIFILIVLLSISSLLLPGIMTIPSISILKKKGIKPSPVIVCTVIGAYIWVALIIYLCMRFR